MSSNSATQRASAQRRYRSNRKQYQSCDHCRKGRRGCDAVRLGIDPLGQVDPNNRCSMCQRYRKQCTFEWLRSVPVDTLPQRIKTMFGTPSQRFQENSTLSSLPVMPSDASSLLATKTTPQDIFHNKGTSNPRTTGFGRSFLDIDLRETQDETLPSLFSGSSNGLDFPGLSLETVQSHAWHELYNEQPDNSRHTIPGTTLPSDSSYDLLSGTTASDFPVPIYEDADFQARRAQSEVLDPKTLQQADLSAGWPPFPLEWHSMNERPGPAIPLSEPTAKSYYNESHAPRLSPQESQLADTSNKTAVAEGLMKIYQDSLENALSCWITAENCPYNIKLRKTRQRTLSDVIYSPSASSSLYSRVFELDAGFSSLRSRPLTRAEHSGSSRALKLAIVAFASQWSYSSQLSPSDARWVNRLSFEDRYATERQPSPDHEAMDTYDFEGLLRQSVWNEARRCIDRWKYCGSFRVIFAIIMFSLTQQPPNEDELGDSSDEPSEPLDPQMPSQGEYLLNPRRPLMPQSYSPTISGGVLTSSPSNPQISSFSRGLHDGSGSLGTAIHHLLNWKARLLSYSQDHGMPADTSINANRTRTSLLDPKSLYDFNLVFWLGIMYDTTASVLGQSSLIAPDSDTLMYFELGSSCNTRAVKAFENLQTPSGMTTNKTPSLVNIWDSYIIEVDEARSSNLAAEGVFSAQLDTKTLQAAVPLKVLFWRKISKMQQVFSQPKKTSPAEVESVIKEALRVHDYWIMEYDTFFKACVGAHSQLSFQVQSWHLVLGMGWNLGCLLLARCIEFADQNSKSERLGRSLRASSALVNQLRKSGAYSIANLGRASGWPVSNSTSPAGSNKDIHFAISQSAILAEPHPDKLIRALEMACQTLLDWLQCWRSPTDATRLEDREWLYANTSSDEISRHCVSCIDALKVLRRNSDAVNPIIYRLTMQHRLLELGHELQTESGLFYTS
ncbi:uncharacterized protein PV06_09147 [Exophiala oligosperma]|uniref:Zn(2)-C6 fungal-type domain-containing protein n=1 Tax=Exophiala oligosperma TaxID=215243 RepID=A0A0D2AGZ0_9EURO|nr:uncharacterized protein PV06_09147 [Exophiala oligosperma]KIW39371.1 hypothetical protein PV06_09147 [Exophiala oligosperma]